jgi:hypothetical protein
MDHAKWQLTSIASKRFRYGLIDRRVCNDARKYAGGAVIDNLIATTC